MPDLTKQELGYIAGMVDGEGCIKFTVPASYNGYKRTNYFILTISNTNKESLTWIQSKLNCGNLYEETASPKHKRTKPCFIFRIASRLQIALVLKALLPYLIIKKDKAKECIIHTKLHPYRGYNELYIKKEVVPKCSETICQ